MDNTNKAGELKARVTNIQKYTIHDGPGIRTEFFFKGCPLRCPWCSNPETLDARPQIGAYPSKCLGQDVCNYCVKACPLGEDTPIKFSPEGELLPVVMKDCCYTCMKCVDACPGSGLKLWGKDYTMEEMLKIAESDRSFYDRTGGGVTVSGGDVMLQWQFAKEFLKRCKERGIGTCVETEAFCPVDHLDAVMEYADLIIVDIKHIDPERHKEYFGVDNKLILSNIKHLDELGKPIVVRTPIVPGYNGDDANIRGIAEFLRDNLKNSLIQYQLLPFRKMGVEKYDSLGMKYPLEDYKAPERVEWEENLLRLRALITEEYGVPAAAGTSGKLPL